jgi:cysteine desulfurase
MASLLTENPERIPRAAWSSVQAAMPIYLDHQATTPLDPRVLQAMLPFWTTAFGNPHALANAHGRAAADAVHTALSSIGGLIGAPGAAMVLTSGATEASTIAVSGVCASATGGRRNRLLIGALEHPSVVAAAEMSARAHRLELVRLPATADGLYDVGALAALVDDRTLLVSTMAANNEVGTLQPLAALGPLVKGCGALWHVDAAQAPLGLDVTNVDLGIDLLTLSAHKMHGPQGIGALYVRPSPPVAIAALQPGGGQQRGLRGGTVPVALAVGMGAAAALVAAQGAEDRARMAQLRDSLQAMLLMARPDITILGGGVDRLAGCLAIHCPGLDAEALLLDLAADISLSTGAACASVSRTPSATLRAMGLTARATTETLRLGLGRFTTAAEIAQAGAVLCAALRPV